MSSDYLLLPMFVQVLWSALLYILLTLVRAPKIWGLGAREDGSNPWGEIEPRVSANLSNQFEWPLLFYIVCLLQIVMVSTTSFIQIALAWVFISGRVLHSSVQILTTNIRLRGIVFSISFGAALVMWCLFYSRVIYT